MNLLAATTDMAIRNTGTLPVMNLNRETKVHTINFYLKKNDVCTSPSKKACVFHLGSKVSTMRVEQVINRFFQISANGNEQEM